MYQTPDTPLAPDAFHDRIYAGEILRFGDLPAMAALAAYARDFLEAALAPHPPAEIHRHHGPAALVELIPPLQTAFARSAEARRLWQAVFEAVGLAPDRLARDRLRLRFQLHEDGNGPATRARSLATVGFHRDSWGTNLYAQVNWWAPVYLITAGRTMAFYPDLWQHPLRNSSAEFDLAAVLESPGEVDRLVPRPLEPVDPAGAVPVVIAPGEVIAFSTAHAHAGVPNQTGLTRISLETRTLWIDDVRAGRGAPNLDGAARWAAPGLFRRVSDRRPLNEVLGVDRLVPFAGVA